MLPVYINLEGFFQLFVILNPKVIKSGFQNPD